jgi:uncharacterized protein YjiS (DUF1127 family)
MQTMQGAHALAAIQQKYLWKRKLKGRRKNSQSLAAEWRDKMNKAITWILNVQEKAEARFHFADLPAYRLRDLGLSAKDQPRETPRPMIHT